MARIIPYLAVDDAVAAIAFYVGAFGATETTRVPMDDGRVGHAELAFGDDVVVFLADEYPEIGFVGPRTLGGTTSTIHLDVVDVDAVFAAALAAGATAQAEPADQAHGARQGTLIDPFGHRWTLSQPLERQVRGGIWGALNFLDAPAGIRFVCDVLGFEEQLVVADEDQPEVIVHSQLRWPEGGIVQAATANRPGNVFSERPVGSNSLYVITADPRAVYDRCLAAGVELISPLAEPDHDPGGLAFSIRDPEGNLWSFGTYDGENSGGGD